MLKINPRDKVIRNAELEFEKFFLELSDKYDLTYAEMFYILSRELQSFSTEFIKVEREEEDDEDNE